MGTILAPVNDIQKMPAYHAAGAGEFYLGFFDPVWDAAFGPYVELNRMSGFGTEANSNMFAQALGAVGLAKSLGARVYITFNASVYPRNVHAMVRSYFEALAAYGADGVILSGPELADDALACGLQAVASTMCGIYNTDIAQFFEACGFTRIILPRDLTLSSIAQIVETVPGVEYEAFAMRNGCVYSDSSCLGMHGRGRGAMCGEMRAAERLVRTGRNMDSVVGNSNVHCKEFHQHACGLCALWDLEQMGVSAYKVVGRGDDTDAICEDIRIVAHELEIAAGCATREEYLERMAPHPYAETVCDRGLNCYYPEVRF